MIFPPNDEMVSIAKALGYRHQYNEALFDMLSTYSDRETIGDMAREVIKPPFTMKELTTLVQAFTSGRDGAIYSAYPVSTLNQLSTGTTPVTAVTNPIGFQADQHLGLALGPELALSTSSTTGWTANDATVTSVSGALNIETGVDYGRAFHAIAVEAGKTYRVTTTVTAVSGSDATSISFSSDGVAGGGAAVGTSSDATGSRVALFYWVAPATATYYFRVQNNSVGASVNRFSGVSIRLLDGNHSIQATAAARPTWSNRVNLLTYSEDFSNAAWQKLNGATAVGNTFTLVNANSYIKQVLNIYAKAVGTLRFTISSDVPTTLFCGLVDNADGSDSKEQTINVTTTPTEYTFACDWSASATFSGEAGLFFNRTGLASPTGSTFTVTNLRFEYGTTATRYQRVTTATDFDTAGFPYYISALGTDDHFTSATGGGGSSGFFWCGAIQPTGGAGTGRVLWGDKIGSTNGYAVRLSTANLLTLQAGNGAALTSCISVATVDVGTKYLLTVWDDGTNLNVQVGSNAVVQVARPVVVAGTAGFTRFKENDAASAYFIGYEYASVYFKNTAGTAAERAAAQEFCKMRAGMQ